MGTCAANNSTSIKPSRRARGRSGGFTLAELLIVVAIILVLVAIAIPLFSGSLNQAKDAVDKANARSVKSTAFAESLRTGNEDSFTYYYVDNDNNLIDVGMDTKKIPAGTEYAYWAEVGKNPDGSLFVWVDRYTPKP
ncbi:MAG: prepilin-type N-terminal cleavage/methylation domain-containing protein [Raoultibacter sp.]